jgi:hypothetical protein
MRLYGGTMSRVFVALVLLLLTAGACGGSGSSEGRGGFPRASKTTDVTSTTTTVVGPEVEGVQLTPTSVPPVVPALPPPASVSGGSGGFGPYPRRGFGCRRAPYPKCSQTTRRPCCRPGDPRNAQFRAGPHKGGA